MKLRYIALPLLLSIFALGCADETEPDVTTIDTLGTEADTAAMADPAMAGAATLNVYQQEPYGEYLVDADSMSLYLFKADSGQTDSQCYDACADAWPPLTAQGRAQAGDPAVQSDLIGTIERQDGSMQVTYNDWPLYYFQRDQQPGDTEGQDVTGFGAEWYLVSPQGSEVHAEGQ